MKLHEMREMLAARGIQLTRSLGQNFLHDGNQLRRITALAELRAGDRVLEIGPGLGPLTEQLLGGGADVLAIEKDARLAAVLRERLAAPGPQFGRASLLASRVATHKLADRSGARLLPSQANEDGNQAREHARPTTSIAIAHGLGAKGSAHDDPARQEPRPTGIPGAGHSGPAEPPAARCELIHGDALSWLRREARDWRGWKMVSNLPYSVASPLLVELADSVLGPDLIVATLQLEVVQRLVAGPGSKDYGVISLLVQLGYEPTGSFKIPRTCFFPEPDVDSGCLGLRRRTEAPLTPSERRVFSRVVKRAFSERRKKALKLLRFDWPAEVLAGIWVPLGLADDIRAERITRAQFVELARWLAAREPDAGGPADGRGADGQLADRGADGHVRGDVPSDPARPAGTASPEP